MKLFWRWWMPVVLGLTFAALLMGCSTHRVFAPTRLSATPEYRAETRYIGLVQPFVTFGETVRDGVQCLFRTDCTYHPTADVNVRIVP